MITSDNWFHEWFNTSYYHILYAYRSDEEAQDFIKRIIEKLNWNKDSYILDLACGKGRHSNYLASQGMKVLGIDLSEQNIEYAKAHAHPNATFKVGDMREIPFKNEFDIVVNLFTSFGYFDDKAENTHVLKEIFDALKPGGTFVFDYLNPPYVLKKLHVTNSVYLNQIHIKTHKRIEGEWVIKQIDVKDGTFEKQYFERVNLLDSAWLSKQLVEIGFEIKEHYGDYKLSEFDINNSPRSILVANKPY